ncbi:serine aminopeptidase domain-containing protein [Bizionia paragorgiae]|uniref:alpha/beta hydrolase n=1 Tax=Bizionia paragorgiae TaxID=283786 RepID=UPI00299E2ADD|nr:alpha/beta hydrolase [Bizionia paragorgiae]MDX1271361.1 alpha/beta hydrolase [Bizionia paragorgiae]
MKTQFIIFFLCITCIVTAQDNNHRSSEVVINKFIEGTLLLPNTVEKPNLVIIIAGSGPTDRDGNQNFLKNNALKKLAVGLTNRNLATFRYDKRIVKQIRKGKVDKNMLFEDFITDAISVIDFFKNQDAFNKIYIAGHSQGSLVGLVAAQERADGFISLAGAGQRIDHVIMEQITKTAPMFTEDAEKTFSVLRQGKTTTEYPKALEAIFNKEVQPFISNWMQYDPQTEIQKLQIPVLIINGTKDLQVTEAEAQLLHQASPESEIKIIENMNHVLVTIEGGTLENSKSYNESARPLSPEVIDAIVEFIK